MNNMSNYAKLVADSAKHMIPMLRQKKLDNLGIIRLPNNMFKTAITYEDKTFVFMAKPFTKTMRNLYGENGCSVRAYVLEDGFEPDDIKWSDEPSMVYNHCSGETANEVVSLITSVMEFMGYDKFSYLNIDYDPIHVCDSIDINMNRILKMYKDVQKGRKWKVTGTGKISPDDIKNSVDIIKNIDTAIEVREANILDYKVYSVINKLRGTCIKVKITTDKGE